MTTILGISASRRAWGNCEIAAKLALMAACDAGAETRFVRLADLKIEQCRGCFTCVSEAARCALSDDLDRLLDQVDAADSLVLASPVYFGLPPEAVVALLDRLLVRTPRGGSGAQRICARPAVTVTLMGNRKWRGLAEPVLNLTSSLLGFQILDSLALVAEGPGEILGDETAVQSLTQAGKTLASLREGPPVERLLGEGPSGDDPSGGRSSRLGSAKEANRCPTCRSDFFRIDDNGIECPVCGERGELDPYVRQGIFVSAGGERRWGRSWLGDHVASWIRPSVERYKTKRRDILRNVSDLKRRYSAIEGGE